MSLFAGVVYFDGRPVPDWLRASIASSLTRRADDCPLQITRAGLFVCFHDVGALDGDPRHDAADGSFTLLAGDPILDIADRSPERTRADDVALIHSDLASSAARHLRICRGDFSAVHYDPARHRLVLATDKSAIRPVLCHADDEKIIFCSSFRILEAMRLPNLRLDPRGAGIALAASGIIGPFLPFGESWRLAAGEILSCEGGRIERRRYWRWAAVGARAQTEEQALGRAAELLRQSVRLRLRADRSANLLLSGGLDSRVIAACLLAEGVAVDACTHAPEGTADLGFARLYAAAAGLPLREHLIRRKDAWFNVLSPLAAAAFETAGSFRAVRAWHGFDASFQLGHTFHYDPIISDLRNGRTAEVLDLFARKKGYGWPGCRRVLRGPLAEAVKSGLHAVLAEHLREQAPEDRGRGLYVYQTEIGNPPLLQKEMEDIDLHRVEYLTPLADFSLIEHVMTIDPDVCKNHRFYYRLLDLLPDGIKAVPWQSYPTQDPCPVAGPAFAETQWANTAASRAAAYRRGLSRIPAVLRGPLPADMFRRINVLAACALHAAGFSDYTYHLDGIMLLQRWLRMTDQRRNG